MEFLVDLVTFTEEIPNGKLHFLCAVNNITFNLFTGKNLLKQAQYFAYPNKNLTSWSINKAKIH